MEYLRMTAAMIFAVLGIFLGLYVGLWVCFIGGILDILVMVQESTVSTMGVFWAVIKIMFASLIGWTSTIVCWSIAVNLIKD